MIYELLMFIIALLFVIIVVYCGQIIIKDDGKMNENRKKIYKEYMQDLADFHNNEVGLLREENEKFRNTNKVLKEKNKKLKKENERLKERIQQLQINNIQRLQNEIEMLKTTIMRNEAYIERIQHKGEWRK